jgi:hypothetical protein
MNLLWKTAMRWMTLSMASSGGRKVVRKCQVPGHDTTQGSLVSLALGLTDRRPDPVH